MSDYIVGSRRPKPGDRVIIIQKKNYGTEKFDEGIVTNVLTSKEFHPRGHKVRLTNGIVGRVQNFADQKGTTARQPKYEKEAQTNDEQPKYFPSEDDLA
ncbi:MAG TPA: DUF2196 domain-containing protein [Candidatus Nanoarchaeia archaeon]|nr:hypothetical protein [uncultured archaeon]